VSLLFLAGFLVLRLGPANQSPLAVWADNDLGSHSRWIANHATQSPVYAQLSGVGATGR